MNAFEEWISQYKKSDRWNYATVSQSREDAFNAGRESMKAEVERQKEIVLRQTKLNTEVIRERDRLREALQELEQKTSGQCTLESLHNIAKQALKGG